MLKLYVGVAGGVRRTGKVEKSLFCGNVGIDMNPSPTNPPTSSPPPLTAGADNGNDDGNDDGEIDRLGIDGE